MQEEPLEIDCAHGKAIAAVVCCHHVAPNHIARGFVENSDDPFDLQAWCHDCEELYLREQALTSAFIGFNDFRVVCTGCYESIKARHTIAAND